MIDAGEAGRLLLVAIVDMSATDPGRGRQYEDAVLALLPRHGGSVEQRLHSTDAHSEVHLISFESRLSLRAALAEAAPTTRVIEVIDPGA